MSEIDSKLEFINRSSSLISTKTLNIFSRCLSFILSPLSLLFYIIVTDLEQVLEVGADVIMPRKRDPRRDEAFEIWKQSNGEKKLKDIAAELGVVDTQIRKWKSQDKWNEKLNGNVTKSKRNVTNKKKNDNSKEEQKNRSGNPNPKNQFTKRNSAAVKHGLFSKYLPEETLEIVNQVDSISPLNILWMNIKMQFASIMRAQQIMFVENKGEMIKELKKKKSYLSEKSESEEVEYEFQFAWDRHSTFLNSQSRAMAELRSMLKQFYEMAHEDDYRLLELEKMRVSINKTKTEIDKLKENEDDDQYEDDGFIEALEGAAEVWNDE